MTKNKPITQMKLSIYILISLLLCTAICQAQVTIGSIQEPETFSSLQLEGNNGGLRLPQLSESDKGSLSVDTNSAGLIIYNKTYDNLEYWDGEKWFTLGDTIKIYNGLRKDGTEVRLGGKLEKETQINQNNKNLKFITGDTNPGGFSINDTVYVVNGRVVGMKPAKFTVNRSTLKIKDVGNNVSIENKLKIKVENDSMLVRNDSVFMEGQLFYDSKKSDINNKVLISKVDGTAFWGDLKPNFALGKTFLKGNIQRAGTGTGSSGEVWIKNTTSPAVENPTISDELTLTPGKWLIFAKISTKTNTSSTDRLFSWIHLVTPGVSKPIASIGGDIEDDTNIASPELTYLMDIDVSTKIAIKASSENNRTWLIESDGTLDLGEPYFFAIMIENYSNED